ncbi:MAG TPA: hypothetical protein VKH44_06205 [Pirellulaceae bacterium]|nr:hypothetical protein [Pirellulaceae bacterium]
MILKLVFSAPLRLCVSQVPNFWSRPNRAASFAAALLPASAWADESAPLIKRLDDPTRAKVLAALAALVMLGFAMVLLTWLGARIVHRYRHGASYFRPTIRPSEHEWAKKPLPPSDLRPPTSDL